MALDLLGLLSPASDQDVIAAGIDRLQDSSQHVPPYPRLPIHTKALSEIEPSTVKTHVVTIRRPFDAFDLMSGPHGTQPVQASLAEKMAL